MLRLGNVLSHSRVGTLGCAVAKDKPLPNIDRDTDILNRSGYCPVPRHLSVFHLCEFLVGAMSVS